MHSEDPFFSSDNCYLSAAGYAKYELKVRGSRFIGRTWPVDGQSMAVALLEEVRRVFHDATHHCFAFRVGLGRDMVVRAKEGGEPSGNAGKPMLLALESRGLTNTMVVVTRYFGGVKLSTGGLPRAYGQCAAETLERAGVSRRLVMRRLVLSVPYPLHSAVLQALRLVQGEVLTSTFAQEATLVVSVPAHWQEKFTRRVAVLCAGKATVREA